MDEIFTYDILGIYAPVFIGIVLATVLGFVFLRLLGLRRESGMWAALAVLCIILASSNEKFYGASNLVNLVKQISLLGIFAVGLTFVIVTGGIDLSVGSIIGFTGVLIAKIILPAAVGEGDAAPVAHQWGVGLGILLLAGLFAGWAAGGKRAALGAYALLGYVVVAAVCVTLSATDAGTGVEAIDFVLSALGSLGGAGAGGGDAVVRGGVLAVGAVVTLVALARKDAQTLAWAAGVLLAYHFYALLVLAFGGGQPVWLAILVALSAATAVGLAQGMLLTRLNLQPFIVTLGAMLLIRGVSQVVVEGGNLSIKSAFFRTLDQGGLIPFTADKVTYPGIPYLLLIFLVVLAVAAYVLHFTVFGRYVYAIGGNRDAAEYSGIPVKKVETTAYVISAFLGGVAGVCYAGFVGQMSHQVGIAYELLAIAACVLGGCSLRGGEGTIIGVLIGTAVMRVIENGIIMFQWPYTDAAGVNRIWTLSSNWTFVIFGTVILVAVVLDQVVHRVQDRRRVRRAAAAAANAFPVAAVAKG